MPFDFVNGFTSDNGLPSTSALTSTTAHPHTSIQDDIVYSDEYANDSDKSDRPEQTNDSDKSHRPKLNTRVEMQSIQQDTTSVRKVPVTVPGVVDSEDATCQDSCAKGSSNRSDYWKRVISFGTTSANLIIPVDDEVVSKKNSCKRRTHQKRTYKCKANKKYNAKESIDAQYIKALVNQVVVLQIRLYSTKMNIRG